MSIVVGILFPEKSSITGTSFKSNDVIKFIDKFVLFIVFTSGKFYNLLERLYNNLLLSLPTFTFFWHLLEIQ